MASIFPKNGKIWISLYQNGKRIQRTTGLDDNSKNRKIVETDLLPKLVSKVTTGDISIEKREIKNVEFYITSYLRSKEKSIKESSLNKYHSITKAIPFKSKDIKSIKTTMIEEWLHSINLSPKTFRDYITVLNGIFRQALKDDYITKIPTEGIDYPKLIKAEIMPFSPDEVDKLLSLDSDLKNFMAFGFYTGMRTGEIIGLKWSDIDLDGKQIVVRRGIRSGVISTTKTNNIRFIPLFSSLLPYINDQFAKTGLKNEFVFLNEAGKHHHGTDRLSDKFKKLLKVNFIPERKLYNMRHTFITNMLELGVLSINDVAYIVGHSTPQMIFSTYNRFISHEKRKIDRNIDPYSNHIATEVLKVR